MSATCAFSNQPKRQQRINSSPIAKTTTQIAKSIPPSRRITGLHEIKLLHTQVDCPVSPKPCREYSALVSPQPGLDCLPAGHSALGRSDEPERSVAFEATNTAAEQAEPKAAMAVFPIPRWRPQAYTARLWEVEKAMWSVQTLVPSQRQPRYL